MTLTPWDWFNLATGLLFTSCMTVLAVQHWRGVGDSPLLGGGRVTGTVWAIGMIGLVLSITLPVSDAVDDGLGLGSAILMLVALVVSHFQRDDADSDEAPET